MNRCLGSVSNRQISKLVQTTTTTNFDNELIEHSKGREMGHTKSRRSITFLFLFCNPIFTPFASLFPSSVAARPAPCKAECI